LAWLPQLVIDRALEKGRAKATAEYLAEFRIDLEGFVTLRARVRRGRKGRLIASLGMRSRSCIIDGEAVACDDDGMPSFDRIRYRRHDSTVFLYGWKRPTVAHARGSKNH
jgi:hypothetical protein